jgi:hypothetical protein
MRVVSDEIWRFGGERGAQRGPRVMSLWLSSKSVNRCPNHMGGQIRVLILWWYSWSKYEVPRGDYRPEEGTGGSSQRGDGSVFGSASAEPRFEKGLVAAWISAYRYTVHHMSHRILLFPTTSRAASWNRNTTSRIQTVQWTEVVLQR